jgi:ferredoxin
MAASIRPEHRFLERSNFDRLLAALTESGYRCIGPRVREGTIVYENLERAGQLPAGIEAEQAPGSYRLHETGTQRCFAWANGPQALKPRVFAPREVLFTAVSDADGRLQFVEPPAGAEPVAVIGVRSCDLAALALQDKHFLQAGSADPRYRARREALLLVAVNCTHSAATCFCASTGDGPVAAEGFDLVLDELDEGYLIKSGSAAGERVLALLDARDASDKEQAAARTANTQAADMQTRALPAGDLYEPLMARQAHAQWADVAGRCLACGNCTAVCPTCFCHDLHDDWDVDGNTTTRTREWDSCFTQGHSYLHSHVVRPDTASRYRQWLTHKLGSWHRQYGRSGCTGCGRCISWCPTGIDLTAEIRALLEDTA